MTERIRRVVPPPRVLDRVREDALTVRQREILDELGCLFDKGFAGVTMSELAAQLNCSLRTLYGLASSRNHLVLMVVDRNLRRIGRAAQAALSDEMSALDAVRAYLSAATIAVQDITEEFAYDMAALDGGAALNGAHSDYLVAVTRGLLDLAVEQQEIADVDTAAVARVMAGLGRDFARVEVMLTLRTTPKKAADDMVELILKGLGGNL